MTTRPPTQALLLTMALATAAVAAPSPDPYVQDVERWRAERVRKLTSDTGWLTVAGFFWLQSGENPFGADPALPVALPEGSAPPLAGRFLVEPGPGGDRVRVVMEEAVVATVRGEPVHDRVLATDTPGPADELAIGRLTLWVANRGGSLAVRLRDPECPLRRAFRGIDAWSIDPAWRTVGRYERFSEPRRIEVANMMGWVDTTAFYGRVAFDLAGKTMSLVPIVEGPEDSVFFFVFADETTARETYGGGRFLYADLRPDGTVVLDFNKAYNPPCAFNPHTTCPLPPEGNRMPIAVTAGERDYHAPGHGER